MFYKAVMTCPVCPVNEPWGWNARVSGCSSLHINGSAEHTLKENSLFHRECLIIFVWWICSEQVPWGWRNSELSFHTGATAPLAHLPSGGYLFSVHCSLWPKSPRHWEGGPFWKELHNHPHSWFQQNRNTQRNAECLMSSQRIPSLLFKPTLRECFSTFLCFLEHHWFRCRGWSSHNYMRSTWGFIILFFSFLIWSNRKKQCTLTLSDGTSPMVANTQLALGDFSQADSFIAYFHCLWSGSLAIAANI